MTLGKVRKNFKSFIIETMFLILTIYEKLNFLQLGRHGKSCESRFRQNFKREFDWCGFNIGMCRLKGGKRGAVALDHSFLSKSGKKTPASLSAVNVARELAKEIHKETGRKLSVASVKKVLHNAALYQHIKEFVEGSNTAYPQNNKALTAEIPPNLLFFGVRDSS